ncbi:hypothetical protein DMB66_43895 [Actinoplanes sp. ATCC 53533]|uniref:nuclease-related domain-containing protein n=1 Tax=Actinoplanes sp. ATCC 53533 TaxID=1288362 RepID=UPI000F781058|nr:nuclease-related domain-containing protein [Actinoplanes sp. ATCC 53533]RSM49988.1 hypothetical protein DMB66_43895 [Actinoplanes sp. ATCC 53533]
MEPLIAASMLTAVASALKSQSWDVISNFAGRLLRTKTEPDLVVSSPDGRVYVIEAKIGRADPHFTEIAQVERLAADVERIDEKSEVIPVLVTDAPFSAAMTEMAGDVGVKVVLSGGSAEAIAKSVVDELTRKTGDGS